MSVQQRKEIGRRAALANPSSFGQQFNATIDKMAQRIGHAYYAHQLALIIDRVDSTHPSLDQRVKHSVARFVDVKKLNARTHDLLHGRRIWTKLTTHRTTGKILPSGAVRLRHNLNGTAGP